MVLSRRRKPFHSECVSLADNSKVSFLRIHRSVLLISALLVTSIAVSLYFGSFKPKATRASIVSSPLEFSIELNKTDFEKDENVTVTLSLINMSNKTLKLDWASYYWGWGQPIFCDFYIVDVNGTRIYQFSRGRAVYMANWTMVVNPGERVTNFYYWYQVYSGRTGYDAIVPKGTYSIIGITRWMILTVDGQATEINLETPAISFTIK